MAARLVDFGYDWVVVGGFAREEGDAVGLGEFTGDGGASARFMSSVIADRGVDDGCGSTRG